VISFLVDSIGDVLEVDESTFETAPDTVDLATRELVSGVYKLEGKLLLVLDGESRHSDRLRGLGGLLLSTPKRPLRGPPTPIVKQ